jgi:hypothetical protein
VQAVRAVRPELDDRQDEVVGLVEGVEDLIPGDGDGLGPADATLHLDEAEAPHGRGSGFRSAPGGTC